LGGDLAQVANFCLFGAVDSGTVNGGRDLVAAALAASAILAGRKHHLNFIAGGVFRIIPEQDVVARHLGVESATARGTEVVVLGAHFRGRGSGDALAILVPFLVAHILSVEVALDSHVRAIPS
jgi:hypothetical protein